MNRRDFFRTMALGAMAAPTIVATVTEPEDLRTRIFPMADHAEYPMQLTAVSRGQLQHTHSLPGHTHNFAHNISVAGEVDARACALAVDTELRRRGWAT